MMISLSELYGWTYQTSIVKAQPTCICVQCGFEIQLQRDAIIYECERCMNGYDE